MAAHNVICYYCNQVFDTKTEAYVMVNSRRYAHKTCHDRIQANKPQEERDYEALLQYIKQKFQLTTVSTKIIRQISSYKKEYNFSYSGMLKALTWWFDVKKNTLEKTNGGIGILPYIYNDAKTYYYGLFLAQDINKNKHFSNRVEEIEIQSPRVYIAPPKLWDIEGGNDDQ
jgi:hypothetical protein